MAIDDTHVIQVTNISPGVTKDQLKNLFSCIGKIDDIKLYPELEAIDVSTRVCYVKFKESEDVGVALHLTNTVFVDRALIVVPVPDDKIPDEMSALGLASTEDGANPSNMYQGLTQYPVLPANTELSKVEEIRRTVYVSNIDCTVTPEVLMQFFTQAGEIKYMRWAGDENLSLRNAFVEYTDQNSVVKALGLNGHVVAGHELKIIPSHSAIVKPPILPGISATSKEIEEAMKKVNEAESLISAVVDPLTNGNKRSGSQHRSRSKRSRSRSKRSRTRKKSGSRSRRSRSRRRSKSRRSRSRRKSRSRSKRSRSRRRSRSRSRKSRYRSGSRRRSRSLRRCRRSRSKRSRSRRSRSKKSRNTRSREKKTKNQKAGTPKKKSRSRERSVIDFERKSFAKEVSKSNKYEKEGSHNSDERKSKLPKKEAKRRSRSRSSSNGRSKKVKKSHRDSDRAHEKEKKSRKKDKSSQKRRKNDDADTDFEKESSLCKTKSGSHRYKSPEKDSPEIEEKRNHSSEDSC